MLFYREHFADIGLFENIVYDGVPTLLATLKRRNFRLLLATAKPHVYAHRILAHFGILAPFNAVYGSELDGVRQHKGDLLAYLFHCEAIDPRSAVMVGDRHHDIAAAHANGCRAIGVTYGYGSTDELVQADTMYMSPADIADAISTLDTLS